MTLKESTSKLKFGLVAFGFLVFFIFVYFKLAYAEFVSWDDSEYILENKDVHDFNMNQLFTKFYVGNFHSITMLNYAIDWKIFDKNPMGYHVENIIWHLINSILVYFVMIALKDYLLSEKYYRKSISENANYYKSYYQNDSNYNYLIQFY